MFVIYRYQDSDIREQLFCHRITNHRLGCRLHYEDEVGGASEALAGLRKQGHKPKQMHATTMMTTSPTTAPITLRAMGCWYGLPFYHSPRRPPSVHPHPPMIAETFVAFALTAWLPILK